jgi:hypothetical protein
LVIILFSDMDTSKNSFFLSFFFLAMLGIDWNQGLAHSFNLFWIILLVFAFDIEENDTNSTKVSRGRKGAAEPLPSLGWPPSHPGSYLPTCLLPLTCNCLLGTFLRAKMQDPPSSKCHAVSHPWGTQLFVNGLFWLSTQKPFSGHLTL